MGEITNKAYKKIKERLREEIVKEYLDECQCDDKRYDDDLLFCETITKYKEPYWHPYRGWVWEDSCYEWKCPMCGKTYKEPPIAIA